VRDVSLGINDWYNVAPSVRRAVEGFALLLKNHAAHLERIDRALAAAGGGGRGGGNGHSVHGQSTPAGKGATFHSSPFSAPVFIIWSRQVQADPP